MPKPGPIAPFAGHHVTLSGGLCYPLVSWLRRPIAMRCNLPRRWATFCT